MKLPDIMKAKKKPLETLTLAALGVAPRQQLKLVRFEPPPQRQKGITRQGCRRTGRGTEEEGAAVSARILIVAEHDGAQTQPQHR